MQRFRTAFEAKIKATGKSILTNDEKARVLVLFDQTMLEVMLAEKADADAKYDKDMQKLSD